MDWSQVFPKPAEGAAVPVPEIADIGCGFGGLLFGLAHEPATAGMPSVGLEIRVKVAEYVRLKIAAYAEQSPELVCVSAWCAAPQCVRARQPVGHTAQPQRASLACT